jgi:hypothetical protein
MRSFGLILLAVLMLGGCASEPRPALLGPTPTAPDPTATPGETLPMGQSSVLSGDGAYLLPEGDYQMKITCWGSVDYTVTDAGPFGIANPRAGGCADGGGSVRGPWVCKGPGRIEARFYTQLSYVNVTLGEP